VIEEEGSLPLVVVCSRRGSHPRRTLGGLYITELGVAIGYSEQRGISYRRITVTGNHGRSFYETDDRTVLEFRCNRCGLERDIRADRLARLFKDDTPLMKTLDVSRVPLG
jgi:hypothetical protein